MVKYAFQIPLLGCGRLRARAAISSLLWPMGMSGPHSSRAVRNLRPPGTAGFSGFGVAVPPRGCGGSPVLTPHCHPTVFPQRRHLPEGAAGGGEAEEEGGEAEGDPQGPAHLPLAVGAVAPCRRPRPGARWSLSVCAVGFCFIAFLFGSAGDEWRCWWVAPVGLRGADVGLPFPRAKAQSGRQ